MPRLKLRDELLGHLSPSIWKLGKELAKEIREERRKIGHQHFLSVLVGLFSEKLSDRVEEELFCFETGSMYVYLYQLEEEKLITSRWRILPPDPKEDARFRELYLRRHGKPPDSDQRRRLEYKLTEDGVRRRVQNPLPKEDGEGDLVTV